MASKKEQEPRTAKAIEAERREEAARALGRALDEAESRRERVGERRRRGGAAQVVGDLIREGLR